MIDDEFLQLEFYYDLFIGGIHNFSRKPPISVRPKIYTPGINSITSWQFNFDLETNSKQVFTVFTRKRRTGIKKKRTQTESFTCNARFFGLIYLSFIYLNYRSKAFHSVLFWKCSFNHTLLFNVVYLN